MRAARLDTDVHGECSLAELLVDGNRIHASLDARGEEVRGEDVTAILYRHLHLREAPHMQDSGARELVESELRATLEGTLLSIDAYWLNHPHANRLARSKPLQLALAAREGFSVPDTAITDDPERIRELHGRWDGQVVAKLVGGQIVAKTAEEQYVVHTTLVEQEDLESAASLAACPAIYQRRIEKAFDLRVTVVGDRVFACRIESQSEAIGAVDWRRAGVGAVPIHRHELDGETADRCRAFMRRLGLDLAGLDLVVTPDGETVFMEVNAMGQWLWVQEATDLPIATAIVEQLLEGGRHPRASPWAPAPIVT